MRTFRIAAICLIWASLTSGLRAQSSPEPAAPGEPGTAAAGGAGVQSGQGRADVGSPPPPSATKEGFDFGTYSRVSVGADLRGHSGFGTNVVSHGSRLELAPYLEMAFYYSRAIGGDP